ncbi:MAG: galactose-1-phosphate uridylyltransferase [Deferrisomatales bacterium]
MDEHHIRQDKLTKQWVIYAPSRRRRPTDFGGVVRSRPLEAAHEPTCPFCPGNEKGLGPVVEQLPGPPPHRWSTRVIPNRYPALSPDLDPRRFSAGIYLAVQGHGRHEVVIETPLHNRDIGRMGPAEAEAVVETYHRRHVDLMRRDGTILTITFRNRGPRAGASLAHPHSQIIALAVAPPHVRWREEEAQRYFDEWGRCCLCDIARFEEEVRERVVFENGSFLAFVPFAAEVPCEVWIVPKRHQADFGELSDEEKPGLAQALREILGRMDTRWNGPDYNYVIHSSTQYRAGEPQLHWYLQILPRVTTRAGFEIGSGVSINPSLPEEDAAFLRGEEARDGGAKEKRDP